MRYLLSLIILLLAINETFSHDKIKSCQKFADNNRKSVCLLNELNNNRINKIYIQALLKSLNKSSIETQLKAYNELYNNYKSKLNNMNKRRSYFILKYNLQAQLSDELYYDCIQLTEYNCIRKKSLMEFSHNKRINIVNSFLKRINRNYTNYRQLIRMMKHFKIPYQSIKKDIYLKAQMLMENGHKKKATLLLTNYFSLLSQSEIDLKCSRNNLHMFLIYLGYPKVLCPNHPSPLTPRLKFRS